MPLRRKASPTGAGAGEAIPGYRDLHPVGRGGFSVVYRAHQRQLDRVVAVKVLAVDFVDARVRRRYLREIQLTSRLTGHPHVVTVLDSGVTASGRPYIAMEYFERGSLHDRLAAEGPLPVPEVLRIGVKVAGALAAAHQEGVLHRDVKPGNVLVSRFGEPALADFGTARLTGALDLSSRTEALTPYHAAPEVLRGETPSAACDIYSLGSTLYQLLCGRPPFTSDEGGIAGLLLRMLSEDPPPITRGEVPPALLSVVRRAMARDAPDRYPDAWALAQALQRVQRALRLPLTELPNGGSLPPDSTGVDPTDLPTPATILPTPATITDRAGQSGPATAGPVVAEPAGLGAIPLAALPIEPILIEPIPGEPLTSAEVPAPAGAPAPTGAVPPATSNGTAPNVSAPAAPGRGISTDDIGPWDDGQSTPKASAPTVPPMRAATADTPPVPGPAPRRRWPLVVGITALVLLAVAAPVMVGYLRDGTATPAAHRSTVDAAAPASPGSTMMGGGTAADPSAGRADNGGRNFPGSANPQGSASPDGGPGGGPDVSALRPTGLTAVPAGATVLLTWQIAPGARDFNEIVTVSPREPTMPVMYLNPGTTSYPVSGLNPQRGYCFQVSAVVSLGIGQDPVLAPSDRVCVRGAVVVDPSG